LKEYLFIHHSDNLFSGTELVSQQLDVVCVIKQIDIKKNK